MLSKECNVSDGVINSATEVADTRLSDLPSALKSHRSPDPFSSPLFLISGSCPAHGAISRRDHHRVGSSGRDSKVLAHSRKPYQECREVEDGALVEGIIGRQLYPVKVCTRRLMYPDIIRRAGRLFEDIFCWQARFADLFASSECCSPARRAELGGPLGGKRGEIIFGAEF